MMRKRLIIQVAGLGWDFLRNTHGEAMDDLSFQAADTVFPAVTCTVQASFRTALAPALHGMPSNGYFDRALRKPLFWEQSAGLVDGPRIWDGYRAAGARVGMLFWQQSLGETVDLIVSPAPIHRHHGGMIPTCYSQPADLYDRLTKAVGHPFRLRHYWGPLASVQSSQWIAEATAALLRDADAPEVCFTYLPGLDYNLQRYGPGHIRARQALQAVIAQLRLLLATAASQGYDCLIFGDYALVDAHRGPVHPNRVLREAGWFQTREIRGMQYADLAGSRAFAVCDHEVAQVIVADPADAANVRAQLEALPGVDQVIPARDGGHPRCAFMTLVAEDGAWFSYKWWRHRREAPDYATHVDIHNKPGFDPCELFFGWPPGAVSSDDSRVGGTHGKTGEGRKIAWASTCGTLAGESLIEIAAALRAQWT